MRRKRANDRRRTAGLAAASGAVVLALAGFPPAAHAINIFGWHVFEKKPTVPPGPDARPYTVTVEVPGNSGLKKVVRNASNLVGEIKTVPPSTAVLLTRAKDDYARILAALYAKGYYGPVIRIMIGGKLVGDVPPTAILKTPVPITIHVEPGPLFTFGKIAIRNAPPPVPNDRTVPKSPAKLGLVPGHVAESGIIFQSEASLLDSWRELGHPKPSIVASDFAAFHPTSTLNVGLTVDPGPPAVLGPVAVSGTAALDPAFVAYYSGLRPGQPYDPDRLERARDQLARLDVFKAYRIVEADKVVNGQLPLDIVVVDRPRHVYGFGTTYATTEGLGASAYWKDRNLFGHAESLRFDASVGRVLQNGVQDYDYSFGATYTEPGVFTPFTDWKTRALAEQNSPDTYLARRVLLETGLEHRFTKYITGTVGVQGQIDHIENAVVGNGDFQDIGLPLALRWDARDNPLDPTHGFNIGWLETPFYEFHYGNAVLQSELRAATYFGFADGRFVLALQAAAGSLVGAPLDELPASRLFFAGGGGSIRGYPYRGVGPIDAFGQVYGGRSYFTGSVEGRIKITKSIGVVPFFDFGNAFTTEYPDFSQPLRTAVGIGARYYTGLGPIRFDVAVPLDKISGDPSVEFYIGIGQAF